MLCLLAILFLDLWHKDSFVDDDVLYSYVTNTTYAQATCRDMWTWNQNEKFHKLVYNIILSIVKGPSEIISKEKKSTLT